MQPPPERIPDQDELLAAGIELGLFGSETTKVPGRHYKKLVKVVRESWREIETDIAEADGRDRSAEEVASFSTSMADHLSALRERDIPEPTAARIAAAIAPYVWRDIKGAAHS